MLFRIKDNQKKQIFSKDILKRSRENGFFKYV